MQYFLQDKKNASRRAFYESIFNIKISYTHTSLFSEGMKIFKIDCPTSATPTEFQVAHFVSRIISYAQYAMINQDTHTQDQIVDAASDKLIEFLKLMHAGLVKDDTGENIDAFWVFLKDILMDSLQVEYNGLAVKSHVENLCLHNSLLKGEHLLFSVEFDIIRKLCVIFGMNKKAIAITDDVIEDSWEILKKAQEKYTRTHVPYGMNALVAVGVGVVSYYGGMPYAAVIGGCLGFAALRTYHILFPRLSKEAEQEFLSKGAKIYFDKSGNKVAPTSAINPYLIKLAIGETINNISFARQLRKKTIRQSGNDYKEVYIPSHDISSIPDITRTQQKKIKGQRVSRDRLINPEDQKEKIRHITLPASFQGSLIECQNDTLVVLQKPRANSKITPEMVDSLLGDRGEIVAKKFGQSGLKILNDHTFWLKDKNTKTRIIYQQAENETVLVDGIERSVPSFYPSKVVSK